MVTVALLVRLEAKPGKEQEVAELLSGGLPVFDGESTTTAWFGLRFGVTTFGIFEASPDEQAPLAVRVAAALKENAHLFEETPSIETADVLTAKIPG
jgi:hypothetical protein